MSSSDYEDFYFGISDNKIHICFFEKDKTILKNPQTLKFLIH